MPDEDKTFSGSLVLDLRISWRHVHTLYSRAEEEHVYYLNYSAAEFMYNIYKVGRWQSSLLAIKYQYISHLKKGHRFQFDYSVLKLKKK